ncbi:MAG: hypothetical protein PHV35_02800 [Mariniphaga sp.]|nr:hypothetical protein [Mariniphaga sp.]MDD4227288.1 hypothetical protein [Mariniphaga sp.]
MSSIKRLKKEVDLIMTQVLSDCFYMVEYNPKVDAKAVMEIAGEMIEQHRDFRIRANHPDGKDNPKLVKKYFNELAADVIDTVNQALEKLSAEVKKTT